MTHAGFVHLRCHSAYSLAEGAIKVADLVALAAEAGMPAVAITDTDNLFGALEFSLAATGAGVQPIVGCQLTVKRHREEAARERPGAARKDRLVLLAKDAAGYENLMALVSHAYLDPEPGADPHIAWSLLEGRSDGLICLTGGPGGPVGRALLDGRRDEAAAILDDLERLFGDRLYMELMRHGTDEERATEAGFLDLAFDRNIPLVATNDCYFATAAMHEAHDILLCIADGTYAAEQNRRRVTEGHYFRSAEEMAALFADLPEAVENTLVIARRCAVMAEQRKPILPAYDTGAGRSEAEELRHQARAGLQDRLETHVFTADMDEAARDAVAQPYRERVEYELDVIEQMGFPGYFLIVADFIKWAKAQGIPVGPGRGSGAGSAVAWALTITDLDPLRFGLLFERFLNPERVSMPDFDIDFCQDRREEVIHYVQQKYGRDRVAHIITFGKLQARAVLRDVGRVLQLPYGQVDRICKLVPNNPADPTTLEQALEQVEQLREEVDRDETVAYMVDIARKLEGLYRHASTHAAGVVIGDRPLMELVPLYRDPRSPMPATQFNMKYVEQAGLVKFDFLGLKTLTVLETAADHIREGGTDIQIDRLPLDDKPTFDLLSRAEAVGVFQVESAGMRDALRGIRPNRLEDLIALISLYRPGPMDNIPTYIEVKNGRREPDYLYPSLEPILKETFGIMIYQEQVMQVAQELAGFSLGGADLLRRAMGKKIKAEMDKQKAIFVDGAKAREVPAAQAANIFDLVAKFAGYGFNKSHAAAYALVSYHTAYLKANYPVEFMAASMTLDLHNTDKLNVFRGELKRLKVELRPPDVNASQPLFAVERDADGTKAIRYALGAIKGVGIEAMKTIVAEREANGPYKSLWDFARRLDPKAVNKRQVENLIRAGALDPLEPRRGKSVLAVDRMIGLAQSTAADRESGQVSLFGGPAAGVDRDPDLPAGPDWDDLEKLRQEHEAIGFYLSAHPIETYNLARVRAVEWAAVEARPMDFAGKTIHMAGIVSSRRERMSKSGNRFAFVELSDASGTFEVSVWAEVLALHRIELEPGNPVLLRVEVQRQDESVRLNAKKAESLDDAIGKTEARVDVHLDPQAAPAVPMIKSLLEREGQGKGEVSLILPGSDGREIEVRLPQKYAATPRLRSALKSIPGVAAVEIA